MADILFDDLKPILNYFPLKKGKAEIIREKDGFKLLYDRMQWCTISINTPTPNIELKHFFLDINLSEGKVVTTGLGFGLLQTTLCQKQEVSEIIVYEKHEEIIDIFLSFVKESNFDISKLKIINKDASECINDKCDWLCMDHFELAQQMDWEIIDQVREINNNSLARNVMFWPFYYVYEEFCFKKRLSFNNDSYSLFRENIKINKLPKNINQELLQKFDFFLNNRLMRHKRQIKLSKLASIYEV